MGEKYEAAQVARRQKRVSERSEGMVQGGVIAVRRASTKFVGLGASTGPKLRAHPDTLLLLGS